MRVTFDTLVKLVRPSPPMAAGFGACEYEFRLLTVDEALAATSCWDKVSSVADHAAKNAPNPKIAGYVQEFPPGPVIAIAFSLDTLARIWPAEYGGRVGAQLVIWDGNNRLCALARRRANAVRDDLIVGAFVGV